MGIRELSGNLKGDGIRIGIVVSRFNDFFTRELRNGALDCLARHGVADSSVTMAWVPGANEIPLLVDKLARAGGYDALIALGAVVQGATAHAGLINSQVSRSLARTAVETGIPVINGVVCAENVEQAIERCGSKAGNKGWDAALAALEMANLYRSVDSCG